MESLLRPASSRCDLWAVPRLWGSRSQGGYPDHIGAIPIVKIGDTTLTGPRWRLKRASDVVFAVTALLVLSPLLLLCRRRHVPRRRPGRVLPPGAHRPVRQAVPRDQVPVDAPGRRVRVADHLVDRARRAGRPDRAVHAADLAGRAAAAVEHPARRDERGGAPAERPYFVEKFSMGTRGTRCGTAYRSDSPGCAGQRPARGHADLDRARFDNYYVENWSLWLDIKIVLRTVTEVFRGGGR
ncbi:sugar transferase [Micromonospora sp. BRA006-A]|nr:sugar transferase [Micromonospora sp. BRA006-A]